MLSFYNFYREYTSRGAFIKPGRMPTPSVVAIADQMKQCGTKSWLLEPMSVFMDLLTKKDDDRINDCNDIEKLHEEYPGKSPMSFAEIYIVYALTGLSMAVAEYLPMYLGDSYEVTLAVQEKERKQRINVIKRKRRYRENKCIPEDIITDMYKSMDILKNVCENDIWDHTPKVITRECIANVASFINRFAAVYKVSQEEFNLGCRTHIINDFKTYVMKE